MARSTTMSRRYNADQSDSNCIFIYKTIVARIVTNLMLYSLFGYFGAICAACSLNRFKLSEWNTLLAPETGHIRGD